jgi:L-arginine dehydrogenase
MSNILLNMGNPIVLGRQALPELSEEAVIEAVRSACLELGNGGAVQPLQGVAPLPEGGDVILSQAVLPGAGVYAVKVSPYLPRSEGAGVVTAWTMLVSLETGDPVLAVDSKELTAQRTAATSALAVDLLAGPDAGTLAVMERVQGR